MDKGNNSFDDILLQFITIISFQRIQNYKHETYSFSKTKVSTYMIMDIVSQTTYKPKQVDNCIYDNIISKYTQTSSQYYMQDRYHIPYLNYINILLVQAAKKYALLPKANLYCILLHKLCQKRS
jgi:uncharacterized protein YqkB